VSLRVALRGESPRCRCGSENGERCEAGSPSQCGVGPHSFPMPASRGEVGERVWWRGRCRGSGQVWGVSLPPPPVRERAGVQICAPRGGKSKEVQVKEWQQAVQ